MMQRFGFDKHGRNNWVGLRSKLSHNIPESFKNLIILIKSQETLLQKIEYSKPKDIDLSGIINLEPPEMINFIKKKNLVKFINKNELTAMKKIDNGHFGSISTAIWKKADKLVVCKK
ncbi:kinase-like domain-containing protein [Rhizophagus irregularis DAOM 181602=DAOM 197198]|nr:kinase-like domain-containing protein [Rhizophagus irregularis DAOM 181602=DAOM 197198]